MKFTLGGEWTVRGGEEGLRAERTSPVAQALEVNVTPHNGREFKSTADKLERLYQREGWSVNDQLPRKTLNGWEYALLQLRRPDARAFDFQLLAPAAETNDEGTLPRVRYFYSIRVAGSSQLDRSAALDVVRDFNLAGHRLIEYVK